jgi:hypothetical protein
MSYPILGLPHTTLFSGGLFVTVFLSRLLSGRSFGRCLYEAFIAAAGSFAAGFLLTLL